jgi:DNA recombination protein RmuC
MIEVMVAVNVLLVVVAIALLAVVLRRSRAGDVAQLGTSIASLAQGQDRTERGIREEIARSRQEAQNQAGQLRGEVGLSLKNSIDTIHNQMQALSQGNEQRLSAIRETVEKKIEAMRQTVEEKLRLLQEDNSKKLEQMRTTVDEKLQGTLDRRLGESFKAVQDQLEQVHKGLGEMQTLTKGVGDLKAVLTNVKTRGTWGEVQLGNLLEQMLTPEQYAHDVRTKPDSDEKVEFAVKLPGREEQEGKTVWLPIDAKFPMEDYQRLIDAQEKADAESAEAASKDLEARIKIEGKKIRDKYIYPPETTDFAIMYLPTEGLYAEVLRRPGLAEMLQRECRVSVAGPTTLAALLNALQMGFRTLAIQKRSSEVWKVLGAVKTEFGNFAQILEGVNKKLEQAQKTVGKAASKTRTIQRKLRDMEELPSPEAQALLGLSESEEPLVDEFEVEPTDSEETGDGKPDAATGP